MTIMVMIPMTREPTKSPGSIDNGKDEKSGKDKENKKGSSGESNGKGPNGKGKNK